MDEEETSEPTRHNVEFRSDEPVPNQEQAFEIIKERIESAGLGHIDLAYSDTKTYWTDSDCPEGDAYYGDHYWPVVVYNGKCYRGLHFSCEEMYVAYEPSYEDRRLAFSAYAHELVHCFLGHTLGDADNNHTEEWAWGEVLGANQDYYRLGW